MEPAATLGEGLGGGGGDGRPVPGDRGQDAELIATQAVGGALVVGYVVSRAVARRISRASPAGWPKVSL